MRPLVRLSHVALLLALLAVLVACTTGGTTATSTSEIAPDESPVPEGMPVMYEFYTDS